jgi:hypothetical protein
MARASPLLASPSPLPIPPLRLARAASLPLPERRSALCDVFADEDDANAAPLGACELPSRPLVQHALHQSRALTHLRRAFVTYLGELELRGTTLKMHETDAGMFPSREATIGFGKWFAVRRIKESHAVKWDESAWDEPLAQRTTKGAVNVHTQLQHIKNHLWPELFPAMPENDKPYWHVVEKQVMEMFDSGGAGMRGAADKVGKHARAQARARGLDEDAAEAEVLGARKKVIASLRAATSAPCAKEHLYQTGQQQVQDVFLSEPFAVHRMLVLNAYASIARQTGCRPGMVSNDEFDEDDLAGPWCGQAPLKAGDMKHLFVDEEDDDEDSDEDHSEELIVRLTHALGDGVPAQ